MFQIWSSALLHELTVLETLSVAYVFSKGRIGPATLIYVCLLNARRNRLFNFQPSTILWPKLKLSMWEAFDSCLSYPDRVTTKMTLGTHVKVHNWTEPFIQLMEFWGTIHPAIYNHQLWDDTISAEALLAVFLQLFICYQWEPGV